MNTIISIYCSLATLVQKHVQGYYSTCKHLIVQLCIKYDSTHQSKYFEMANDALSKVYDISVAGPWIQSFNKTLIKSNSYFISLSKLLTFF